jgi:hypothetical protein
VPEKPALEAPKMPKRVEMSPKDVIPLDDEELKNF